MKDVFKKGDVYYFRYLNPRTKKGSDLRANLRAQLKVGSPLVVSPYYSKKYYKLYKFDLKRFFKNNFRAQDYIKKYYK